MTNLKRCDICGKPENPNDTDSPGPWSEIALGHYKNMNFQFVCGYCTEWLVEILERLKNKKNTDSVTKVWDDVEMKVSME
jgi:hypothetical protein